MVSAWAIRRFLLRHPHATVVRLTVAGGATQDMRPGKQQWSKVADTIYAIAPELIECLDASGALIRAMRPSAEAETSEAAPPAPNAIIEDPETARLTHFANLIHRAYEHSTNVAFTKFVELVERLDARSESMEHRLEQVETMYRRAVHAQVNDAQRRVEELLDAAEAAAEAASDSDKPDMLREMATAFLAGRAQDAARPRANGKGKP